MHQFSQKYRNGWLYNKSYSNSDPVQRKNWCWRIDWFLHHTSFIDALAMLFGCISNRFDHPWTLRATKTCVCLAPGGMIWATLWIFVIWATVKVFTLDLNRKFERQIHVHYIIRLFKNGFEVGGVQIPDISKVHSHWANELRFGFNQHPDV